MAFPKLSWQWERRSQERKTSFRWTVQKASSLHQNSPIGDPKVKNFYWGGGTAPPPVGRRGGHPLPTPDALGTFGARTCSSHLLILESPQFGSHTWPYFFFRKRSLSPSQFISFNQNIYFATTNTHKYEQDGKALNVRALRRPSWQNYNMTAAKVMRYF